MARWGSLELNIYERTYYIDNGKTEYNEITMVPGKDDTPNTVLQQGSRGRKRVEFQAGVTSLEDYDILAEDHLNGVVKEFIGLEDRPFQGLIVSISPGEWRGNFLNYSMSVVEV